MRQLRKPQNSNSQLRWASFVFQLLYWKKSTRQSKLLPCSIRAQSKQTHSKAPCLSVYLWAQESLIRRKISVITAKQSRHLFHEIRLRLPLLLPFFPCSLSGSTYSLFAMCILSPSLLLHISLSSSPGPRLALLSMSLLSRRPFLLDRAVAIRDFRRDAFKRTYVTRKTK